MGYSARSRRSGRRAASSERPPKKRLLIVCEGKVSEPTYLDGRRLAERNVVLEIDWIKDAGDPLAIVQQAVERKQNSLSTDFDEVWCVYDVDDHKRLVDAERLAVGNGIKLAISNPCFELWLHLHFLTHAPGAMSRNKVRDAVRKRFPLYDKKVDYNDFRSNYENAKNLAIELDRHANDLGEPGKNPTTGFYHLTESMSQ
jgi:RloB-like protein